MQTYVEENESTACYLQGVGPETDTTVNNEGGKQSNIPYRCDLLPPLSSLRVAAILKLGAEKYGERNWHNISCGSNINHAMTHVFAYLAGDNQDDHLGHAACRMLMALEIELMNRKVK